jgi:small-conductance mechanosensitive channel
MSKIISKNLIFLIFFSFILSVFATSSINKFKTDSKLRNVKILAAYEKDQDIPTKPLIENNSTSTSILDAIFKSNPNKKYNIFSNIFRLRFVTTLIKKFLQIFLTDPDVLSIVSNILSWVIWSYVVLSIIGTCGIDTKPILSLLSISGLTLGFAAKDILTNTYAGAYIMIMRPFKRGMTISLDNIRGKVISIDTNYVQLLGKDNSKILIPSHTVYGKSIIIESLGSSI